MIRNEWMKNIRDKKAYKEFVGVANCSDIIGATQFNILTDLGMRDYNTLLDKFILDAFKGFKLSVIKMKYPGKQIWIEARL